MHASEAKNLYLNRMKHPSKPNEAMKKIIESKEAPAPIGPYSQAVMYGDVLYVSGQIAINAATGEMDNASIAAETERGDAQSGSSTQRSGHGFQQRPEVLHLPQRHGRFQ